MENVNRTSFFNIFKSVADIKLLNKHSINSSNPNNSSNGEASQMTLDENKSKYVHRNILDVEHHLGVFIKDNFIPNSLEYYIGINPESSDEDSEID
jgi:hypothetical protein